MTGWLTAKEAAQYLRVAHRTVLEWAKTGKHTSSPAIRGTGACDMSFPC